MLAGVAGTESGRREHETGAGGDRTLEVDRLAEAAAFDVLERLAAAGHRFSALSEEAGMRDLGAPFPLVLIDPVDGSLNAKQGIPFFAVMLSLLDGPTVADTRVGYVLNLANGEEWTAIRGEGARRDGAPMRVLASRQADGIELLGIESSPRSVSRAGPLMARSEKVRILGSMALSIAHTAAGSLDVFVAPFPARVFDMTASLLILGESGGIATDLEGRHLGALPAALNSRSPLVAAPSERLHGVALQILGAR